MPTNETWMYQGRQEHGWFGSGTAPKTDSSDGGAEGDTPPPYIATDPLSFIGHGQVGDGECVALVKRATGAPQTSSWHAGESVEAHAPPAGTAVATFDPDGHYGNHTDGTSHAAILTKWTPRGFWALEQYNVRDKNNNVVHRELPGLRFYEFGSTNRKVIDNGSNYRVVR
jgi:hypothetical protein